MISLQGQALGEVALGEYRQAPVASPPAGLSAGVFDCPVFSSAVFAEPAEEPEQ